MKQFIGILFIIVFFVLALLSCSKPQERHCAQEDILYQVECCLLPSHLDSAERVLDTLNTQVLSKKERAHYCFLLVKIKDVRMQYDDLTDSLLKEAEDYFVGSSNKYYEARVCEAVARVGSKRGKTLDHKLEWELKALKSIEQCQHVDPRLLQCKPEGTTEQDIIDDYKYMLIWRVGLTYSMGGYTEEAFDCAKQAHRYFEERGNLQMSIQTAYTLSSEYLTRSEYDSCWKYLEISLQNAEQYGALVEWATCYYVISNYYQVRGMNSEDPVEKERLLRQSNSEAFKGLDLLGDTLRVRDCLYATISRNYFELGQYDSCIYYDKQALDFVEALYGQIVPNFFHANIYHRLYQSYEALGDSDQALQYAKLYFEIASEIHEEPRSMEQIKNDYEKRLEMQSVESEQQMKRYRLWMLLLLSLLALLIVVWLSFRYRKNKEIEDLKFSEEYNRLCLTLEKNSERSRNALVQRVMAIYHSGKENMLESILTEFELSYHEAQGKMKTLFPDLTQTERNIVILSFLDFRGKEEADILHLSLNTVMKYRSVINKKMDSDSLSKIFK